MKQIKKRMHLRAELLFSFVLSFLLALVLYSIISLSANFLIRLYFEENGYGTTKENNFSAELQDYVTSKKISMLDYRSLDRWIHKKHFLTLRLYHNNSLIYDSIYGVASEAEDNAETIQAFPSLTYHEINFSDGTAKVMLYYSHVRAARAIGKRLSLALSSLFFLLMATALIRRKVSYLLLMASELKVLSSGNLDYPITIQGHDELTDVASGLNALRIFALSKIAEEKKAHDTNHELITSLSHDLRTPLTSLIGYLEITQDEALCPPEKTRAFQGAALEKAYRLKSLMDKLFEYFLIDSKKDEITMEPVNGNELIFQMVEEALFDLEATGVTVHREISDISCRLFLNADLIHRVFENIFSNIKKYADLTEPITVNYVLEDQNLLVTFENQKRTDLQKSSGSQIGLKSCKSILNIHKGELIMDNSGSVFRITISLPVSDR